MNKQLLLLALILVIFLLPKSELKAQKAIKVNVSYATFTGEFLNVYNPAPMVNITYHKLLGERGNFYYRTGFVQFTPKEEIFYFSENFGLNFGTIEYDNYLVIPLNVGYQYNIVNGEKFKTRIGLSFGYFFTKFGYHLKTSQVDETAPGIGGQGSLNPNIGIELPLSDKVSINLHGEFNFFFQLGSSEQFSSTYNSSLGQSNSFITVGPEISIKL